MAHAGEEGGPENIRDSLDLLKARRIDHGVRCLEDGAVVERLAKEQIPLTCCPCSNHRLNVFSRYFGGRNVTSELLKRGLKVTINSDDPAYFGGYLNNNYCRVVSDCSLKVDDVYQLCRNSFESTFLPESNEDDEGADQGQGQGTGRSKGAGKAQYIQELNAFRDNFDAEPRSSARVRERNVSIAVAIGAAVAAIVVLVLVNRTTK